jgi:trehalose 6-phosphate phosphatase
MASRLELPVVQIDPAADRSLNHLEPFFQSLAAANQSALLLDFDGTLAPMRVDPSKVRPWAGVVRLLQEIQDSGRTRLAIVTGRSANEVVFQLGMRDAPEIWGLHGAERLCVDGSWMREELPASDQSLLEAARLRIRLALPDARVEEKRNGVVVHWRGKPARFKQSIQSRALNALLPFTNTNGVRLLQFDGGIELRIGRDKGDAVRVILNESPSTAPVAYLGDDATDEDAFQALNGRGLTVLVRRNWRSTAAQAWLRPPAELREFLTAWLRAAKSVYNS